jgi:DNA-binding MarR family transcriptional regulator
MVGNPPLAHNARMAHEPAPNTTPAGNLLEADLQAIIGYQAAQASVVFERIYESTVGKKEELHRVEFTILMLVRANPGCTASSLAKALAVSAPNMALWLERVTAKELLERTQSAADRRANHLRLTQRGEDLAQQATQAILAAEKAMLTGLSVGERTMLAELLHKAASYRSAIDAADR